MAAKKNTSIWLEPSVQRRLKMMSAEYRKPVGEIIESLLNFSDKIQGLNKQERNNREKIAEMTFKVEMLCTGEVDPSGKKEHEILMEEAERWVGDPKYDYYMRLAAIVKKQYDHDGGNVEEDQ